MNPFFSIIVPCCDVAPYLRECLDSVVSQPFADWECLLGVEASKDNTEEIVREYAAKDPRFRVFTGPRTGSCSASRNIGIDMATGEYIIFLDGDDTIIEGSLQRLHDKIAARPGADLYPCAIQVHNDMTGKDEEVRDNYPKDCGDELTGPAATLMIYSLRRDPCPMLQLTVFRREHLVSHGLHCLHGRKRQDSEFSPRALYLAKRVIPLHERFYVYRVRPSSVSTLSNGIGYYLDDYAAILESLIAFHAKIAAEPGFDRRISSFFARHWLLWFYYWFSPSSIRHIPFNKRKETLCTLFRNGFGDFNMLSRASSLPKRIACAFMKMFVKFPPLRPFVDCFFRFAYYPLIALRSHGR